MKEMFKEVFIILVSVHWSWQAGTWLNILAKERQDVFAFNVLHDVRHSQGVLSAAWRPTLPRCLKCGLAADTLPAQCRGKLILS